MAIEVRIPTVLRKHTDGEAKVSGEGSTLAELFDDLGGRNQGLHQALVGSDGQLHRFINVYLNDEDVRFLGGIQTPLQDGDTVSILPAVAGGSILPAVAGG
ncbi:MAG: MoaD/ThiS family protein [Actinomycetota bacterium]|jgi:molybdopterin converting factor small subunit|nr:MoaD/ThiS family protein [Actinomycetota bacterium]